jgi:hypothetical protein
MKILNLDRFRESDFPFKWEARVSLLIRIDERLDRLDDKYAPLSWRWLYGTT